MSEFRHNDIDVDIIELTRPFPKQAIEQRDGGRGQSFDFVATETVIRRLNAATGNRWSFRVTNMEWRPWRSTSKGDSQELLIISGELTIPGLGTRAGTGVQIVNVNGGEDMIKGGASDCLKKAAVSFGVGIDLYGPDLEAGEVQQRQAPAQQEPRQQATQADVERITAALKGTLTTGHYNLLRREIHALGLDNHETISILVSEAEQRRAAAKAQQQQPTLA